MDPKVYIFLFMVLLSIVLADYLEAYKFGDSRMIQEDSDIQLPAYKNGKTRQTVYDNHDSQKSLSKRSSNKSSKKSKKSRHRKRKARTTTKSDYEHIKIYDNDEIPSRNHDGIYIQRQQYGTLKRKSGSIINKQTDNSNIEINNIGLSNNARHLSIAPLTPERRHKKKYNKKYRPDFKYIRLDKNIKKHHSLNPKTDIPDNAEGVLEETDEVYMKVLPPKIQKQTYKKPTEYIVQYENFEENKSVDDEKPQKEKESQERKLSKLRTKNIEIVDIPDESPRKYNPIFQYSNFHDRRHFSNDYSEVIDSGVEVIEVTTTTKAPETTTYGKTEIIYLTPNPENKKYKPIFKYHAVANEPYNYDIPHYRKTDKDQPTYAPDNSNSESKESRETNNNQKTIANVGNKDDSDEDSAKLSSEDDDSNTEEKSKEKRDSDRDNELLKISRKIRARERPTFDIKQYYNKIINENIKEQENMKPSEVVKRYERFEQNIGKQGWLANRPHTRNFKKKILKVKKKSKEVPKIQDTNGHTKIFLTDMGTYNKNKTYNGNKTYNTNKTHSKNKNYYSPHSGPKAMKQQRNMEEAILPDKMTDRYKPALPHDKQAYKVRGKISEKHTIKNDDGPQLAVHFDSIKDRHEPALPYYKQTNKVRDKISERHTTANDDVAAELAILIDRVKNKYESKLPHEKQSSKVRDVISEKYTTTNDDVLVQPAILIETVKDMYEPGLLDVKESDKGQDKIFEEQTIKNYDVSTKRIVTYKEDNMVYHPDMEYNEQFNQIREKFVGKRSTPAETKVFRPSQLKNNYEALLEGLKEGIKRTPTPDERYEDVNVEKNYKLVAEDFITKGIPTADEKYGDIYTEKNYKPVLEDFEKKGILVLDEKYENLYAEKNNKPVTEDFKRPTLDKKYGDIIAEKNYSIITVDFEGKITPTLDARGDVKAEKVYKTVSKNVERIGTGPTLDPRLGDKITENETVTEIFDDLYDDDDTPAEPERKLESETTEMFTTANIITEMNELTNIKRDSNKAKAIIHRKRSTRHYERVRAVKIKKAGTVDELTTTSSEDLTTIADYGETNEQKETEHTPSYQVHENTEDVPDDRPILGPIVTDYVIVPEKNLPLHRKGGIPSLNLSNTDPDQEHGIVNIVQGMKDYFSVIGKGLYTAVKDIFKEKPS